MLQRKFPEPGQSVITPQITRADEKCKSLGPGVVGSFTLGLDVEVTIFHEDEATPPCGGVIY